MRNLRVRLKIDIGRREHNPLPIRRRHWLVHPFQLHHVLKRERMFWWRLSESRSDQEKGNGDKRSHDALRFYFVVLSKAKNLSSFCEQIRDKLRDVSLRST